MPTKEAANLLGVSASRVRQMASRGQLQTKKVGRNNYVYISSVNARLKASPKPGRPAEEVSA